MVVFDQNWLYLDKSGCTRVVLVVIGKKSLHFGKSGFIRTKVVVFEQKWLYSDKVVAFGHSGCIRAKVVVFGQKWF